jgi:putative hydrolase
VTPEEVIDCLIDATAGALMTATQLEQRPQLAHLFSVVPKMGLDETSISDRAVCQLARQARAAGAWLEVNEKWACPSSRTVRAFGEAGVDLVASTDSHDCRDIGAYSWVRRIADGAAPGPLDGAVLGGRTPPDPPDGAVLGGRTPPDPPDGTQHGAVP